MSEPFRDDRAAAHARADHLAGENRELRDRLDAIEQGRRPPRSPEVAARARRAVIMAMAIAFVFAGAGAIVALYAVRRPARAMGLHLQQTWTVQLTATAANLRAITRSNDGFYAVGAAGTILFRGSNATAWTPQQSGTRDDNLNAIILEPTLCAVGDHGAVVVYSPETRSWGRERSPAPSDLHGVTSTPQDVVAVGNNGTIVRRPHNATTWTQDHVDSSAHLHAVAWVSGTLYAVGDNGTILANRSGSTSWLAQLSNTRENLFAIGGDSGAIVVVGTHGTILRTSGDAPWSLEPSGVREDLFAVGSANVSYENNAPNGYESGSRWALVVAGAGGRVLVNFNEPRLGSWIATRQGTREWHGIASNPMTLVGDHGTVYAATP